MFETLLSKPADPLLAIIGLFAADTRDQKMDLGVGVFRDDSGATPVMQAVKDAERLLVETQQSKAYVGLSGDLEFVESLFELSFGANAGLRERTLGVQTPGGSAALRLAADFIAHTNPHTKVWVGTPTWDNHAPVLSAAGLATQNYVYFSVADQVLDFAAMDTALSGAAAGDVVLLQGCCHNPTGSDLSVAQWQRVAELCNEKGLLPFIDVAYHGLGSGLESDLVGVRALLEQVPEAIVTVSCSKNFGLYRERTGGLFVVCKNAAMSGVAQSNVLSIARASYSMPPDHGAAIVRTILHDTALTQKWQDELNGMQQRMQSIRERLARALGNNQGGIAHQKGMFSTLNLTPVQITTLREDHGIYMAGSGRINIAGFREADVDRFAAIVGPLL